MDEKQLENMEMLEFDFFLQWEWPTHITETLHRVLSIGLVKACETKFNEHNDTRLLRWQIATYPESPPAVLDLLANLNDPSLVCRIAENPKTWPVTMARLAEHHDSQVRASVAESANLPIEVIKLLCKDACPDVCYAMAENFALPEIFLQQLSNSTNPYVAVRANRTMARRAQRQTTPQHSLATEIREPGARNYVKFATHHERSN